MCYYPSKPLAELQDFARLHFEPLQYATLLLSGPSALKQLQSLLDEILSATEVN